MTRQQLSLGQVWFLTHVCFRQSQLMPQPPVGHHLLVAVRSRRKRERERERVVKDWTGIWRLEVNEASLDDCKRWAKSCICTPGTFLPESQPLWTLPYSISITLCGFDEMVKVQTSAQKDPGSWGAKTRTGGVEHPFFRFFDMFQLYRELRFSEM